MKKSNIIILVVVLLAALGVGGYYAWDRWGTTEPATETTQTETTQTTENEPAETITYQGETGKTALELLQATAEVEMTGEGEMAFVTSINGVKAEDGKNFWAFLVDGEMAQVGAGSYATADGETITWELTAIDPNFGASEEE